MKKLLKRSAVLVLGVGFLFSVIALSACSEKDLISGNFRTEADADQLAKLSGYVSEENSDKLYGDTQADEWAYNARLVTRGDVSFDINISAAQSNSLSMKFNMDMDCDHTVSLWNEEGARGLRGSGNVDYLMGINMSSGGISQSAEVSLSGRSYNDNAGFYIDGNYSVKTGSTNSSSNGKYKVSLEDALEKFFMSDSAETSGIDFTEIRALLGYEGVKVYVDDSSSFKVKLSLDVNAWADLFAEELILSLEETGGINLSKEEVLEGCSFKYAEYYLDFDKETNVLLGVGSKLDLGFEISFENGGTSAGVSYEMKVASWMISTDATASELPADVDSYLPVEL